jgi:PleD family two-component response regulator
MEKRKAILAIDDILPNLSIIKNILEGSFEVYLAKSAKTASLVLKTNKVDLILLDIEMPDMSGFEYLKQLQESPDYRDIPVIFVTSHATKNFFVDAMKAGAKDFVVKPISTPVLMEKIYAVLEENDHAGSPDEVKKGFVPKGFNISLSRAIEKN